MGAVRWRDYCGISAGELEKVLGDVLAEMKIDKLISRVTATSAEKLMLGSSPEITAVKVLLEEAVTIKIVPVVGDPMMRIVSRFFNEQGLIRRAAIVDISPLTASNRRVIAKIMERVFRKLDQKPWQFTDLKFRLAVLLRLKIKRNWSRLLSDS